MSYELGYRTQLHSHLSFSAASYFNDYDNLRSLERLQPSQVSPFPAVIGNGLKSRSYGAELSAEYQVEGRWRLRAAYSPLQIHFSHKLGSTDANPGTNESHDSNHQFSVRSLLDLPGHLEFDNTVRYVSAITNQSVPGYSELDSRFAWRPNPKTEISVLGTNLLHSSHPEFGTLPGRREIKRGVSLKGSWSF
jgi:iron complex outermembrane receptor protein